MKLVDTLKVEAQAFRDQVAGIKKKKKNSCINKTHNKAARQ